MPDTLEGGEQWGLRGGRAAYGRNRERGCVQRGAPECLGEGANALVIPPCLDRAPHSVSGRCPGLPICLETIFVGELDTTIHRCPAHELRVEKVLRSPPYLPDPVIRLLPYFRRVVDEGSNHAPGFVIRSSRAAERSTLMTFRAMIVDVGCHDDFAVDVQLALSGRGIADPDGTRLAIAGEVLELAFRDFWLALAEVHDLRLLPAVAV